MNPSTLGTKEDLEEACKPRELLNEENDDTSSSLDDDKKDDTSSSLDDDKKDDTSSSSDDDSSSSDEEELVELNTSTIFVKQDFLSDQDYTIGKVLRNNGMTALDFSRWRCGETHTE